MNLSENLNNFNNTENALSSNKTVWAIGGGKGGVGKSLVTANVSICLALLGHKVVTIDLDLGGANIHTCLGVDIPNKTLSDLLSGKVKDINSLIVPTKIKNLSIISGAQDELSVANLRQAHKSKLISHFQKINADYILFDLGAGTTNNTLDFFISSHKGVLVVLPEPTSIENTYRFIKSVYFRRLKMIEGLLGIQPLINKIMNSKMSEGITPRDMINKVKTINPEAGHKLQIEIEKFKPRLIMNQVRSQNDIDIGYSIQNVCKRYFGIDMEFTGYLDYDSCVWQSVKRRKPLLMEFPESRLVHNFDKIVHRLLQV